MGSFLGAVLLSVFAGVSVAFLSPPELQEMNKISMDARARIDAKDFIGFMIVGLNDGYPLSSRFCFPYRCIQKYSGDEGVLMMVIIVGCESGHFRGEGCPQNSQAAQKINDR